MFLIKLSITKDKYPVKDCYPFNLEIFQKEVVVAFNNPVTFFAGENGSGKSTLLRSIARRFNIYIWETQDRTPAKYNPYSEELYRYIQYETSGKRVIGSFFSSEIFRHFAELLDEWAKSDPTLFEYFGGSSLTEKSHGQCNMSFFENRFKIPGLYLLDEPESALSPRSQIEFLKIIRNASLADNVQFIIATHSPILLALPESEIWAFGSSEIERVKYEDTDYYKLYKGFLNNKEQYLNVL